MAGTPAFHGLTRMPQSILAFLRRLSAALSAMHLRSKHSVGDSRKGLSEGGSSARGPSHVNVSHGVFSRIQYGFRDGLRAIHGRRQLRFHVQVVLRVLHEASVD